MKKILLLCFFFLSIFYQSYSQSEKNIHEWLPALVNNSNAGTEFFLTFHPCWETTGSENFNKIYVSSAVETNVTVSVESKGFKQTQKTIANGIIVFNLAPGIGQCYRKSDREIPEDDQVWQGSAVHVKSEDPIVCYGITRFQYTSDGYLAIPVNTYGKEYIVSSWSDIGSNQNPGGQYLTSYSSAVAAYDNTVITYTGGGPSFSSTTTGIKVGENESFELNKGDVLLMASLGTYSDLTGSKFTSNKPIIVMSGNFCSYVPEFTPACDYMIDSDYPTHTWGYNYVVTPVNKREKNPWTKIYAKEELTNIYRDGILIGQLTKGGGGIEGEAYLSQRILDHEVDPRPVVVSSDKPIMVVQYNPGQNDDGVPSDPFQMSLTPYEQWSKEILYHTPGFQGDGFQENYLNIAYQVTDAETIPDDFEFAKVENGKLVWKKLSDMYPDPGQKLGYQIDNKTYFSKIIMLSGDGLYSLRSSTPFGAYAYGLSSWDSYGNAAFALHNDLTYDDNEAPQTRAFIVDDNGIVKDFQTSSNEISVTDLPEDETRRSNMSKIVRDPVLSENFDFSHSEFVPGDTQTATWSASVIDNNLPARLVLYFVDRAGNYSTKTITYKYENSVIDEEIARAIEVYPNPSNGIVNIKSNKQDLIIKNIKVLDNQGKQIQPEITDLSKIFLNQLSNGFYYLEITTNQGKTIKPLVLNK